MGVSTHLSFSGQCKEAFTLYAQLFDGELSMLAYKDTPMGQEVPAEWADKIVHATLEFDGGSLAGSDLQPEQYLPPQGFSVLVDVSGVDKAERIFNALAEGGRVQMPIQKTFWSPAFGILTDRFGTPWEINGSS